MSYIRFAIYYVPPPGTLAEFGARWLGWDVARGGAVAQPELPGLVQVTSAPRKYGFHGTLKPPFRLADGATQPALEEAIAALAARLPAAQCDGLILSALGQFLALTPVGDAAGLAHIASSAVETLDRFRAPAGEAELTRRRAAGLSDRQEALLQQWGYPYVMDQFRFHMTLTGRLQPGAIAAWHSAVQAQLPALPAPFVMDQIALAGEREDGHFAVIHRYTLTG